uniref:Uncharacterized protein n=1 Tax=viral metagenome TaxID=1070528 RepID=A0A6C0DPZ0_9ZZZZ
MEPITKEMLQKACSVEVVAKNKEARLREMAMPIVTEVYELVKSRIDKFSDKTRSITYTVGQHYPGKVMRVYGTNEDNINRAVEILKEYFPGCKVYTGDVQINEHYALSNGWNGMQNVSHKQITVDWS